MRPSTSVPAIGFARLLSHGLMGVAMGSIDMTGRFITTWQRGFNAVASFLYPEICQYCREQWAEAEQGFICRDCGDGVRLIRPPFCDRCGLPFAGAITGPF